MKCPACRMCEELHDVWSFQLHPRLHHPTTLCGFYSSLFPYVHLTGESSSDAGRSSPCVSTHKPARATTHRHQLAALARVARDEERIKVLRQVLDTTLLSRNGQDGGASVAQGCGNVGSSHTVSSVTPADTVSPAAASPALSSGTHTEAGGSGRLARPHPVERVARIVETLGAGPGGDPEQLVLVGAVGKGACGT